MKLLQCAFLTICLSCAAISGYAQGAPAGGAFQITKISKDLITSPQ
jgi:hypothetical protein